MKYPRRLHLDPLHSGFLLMSDGDGFGRDAAAAHARHHDSHGLRAGLADPGAIQRKGSAIGVHSDYLSALPARHWGSERITEAIRPQWLAGAGVGLQRQGRVVSARLYPAIPARLSGWLEHPPGSVDLPQSFRHAAAFRADHGVHRQEGHDTVSVSGWRSVLQRPGEEPA